MGKLGEWEEIRASGISAFFPVVAGIFFGGLLWHCAEVLHHLFNASSISTCL